MAHLARGKAKGLVRENRLGGGVEGEGGSSGSVPIEAGADALAARSGKFGRTRTATGSGRALGAVDRGIWGSVGGYRPQSKKSRIQ